MTTSRSSEGGTARAHRSLARTSTTSAPTRSTWSKVSSGQAGTPRGLRAPGGRAEGGSVPDLVERTHGGVDGVLQRELLSAVERTFPVGGSGPFGRHGDQRVKEHVGA